MRHGPFLCLGRVENTALSLKESWEGTLYRQNAGKYDVLFNEEHREGEMANKFFKDMVNPTISMVNP